MLLTDGDEQRLVRDTADGVLQVVHDDRRQDSLSSSRLAANSQSLVWTLEEASQVGGHPETGHLSPLVGEVRSRIGDVGEHRIFRSEP